MVTVFAHVRETENPFYKEINEVLNSFKDGSNKSKIEAIRLIPEKKEDKKEVEKSVLSEIELEYLNNFLEKNF